MHQELDKAAVWCGKYRRQFNIDKCSWINVEWSNMGPRFEVDGMPVYKCVTILDLGSRYSNDLNS